MKEESLLESAYEFVSSSKNAVSFANIWKHVCKEKGLSEEEAADKVSQFYTTLLLDGRFVTLGENKWDLRTRHTFDKVHIDMRDVYSDVDANEDEDNEEVEEKEYNEVFEEKVIDRKNEMEADVGEEETTSDDNE